MLLSRPTLRDRQRAWWEAVALVTQTPSVKQEQVPERQPARQPGPETNGSRVQFWLLPERQTAGSLPRPTPSVGSLVVLLTSRLSALHPPRPVSPYSVVVGSFI